MGGGHQALRCEDLLKMSGPRSGIRAVDLTSVIMGPFASQQLADLDGPSATKIEPPGGDVMRARPAHAQSRHEPLLFHG